MYTITQTKNGVTNDDNKREWISINTSLLYGYNNKLYDKNEVMERIINNCATRVNINQKQFLQLFNCTILQF